MRSLPSSGATGRNRGPPVDATYLNTLRRFPPNVRFYLISAALCGFTVSSSGIFGVLPNIYLLRLGYGPEFIGIVGAAGALGFAACSLPAVALGRRWGSRRAMLSGLVLMITFSALFCSVQWVPAAIHDEWLVGTRLLRSLGFALYMINATPFLMASAGPADRTFVFSLQASLVPLTGFAGSLSGGFIPGIFSDFLQIPLDSPAPFSYTLLLASALLAPALPALLATREVEVEPKQETKSEAEPAPYARIAAVMLIAFLQVAGASVVVTFFNVYMDAELNESTGLIGTLIGTAQLVGGVAALSTPFLAARWGHKRVIMRTSLGISLSLVLLALVPHWSAAGLAYVSIVSLTMIRFAAFSVFHQELVAAPWRRTMAGVYAMAGGLGYAASSLGGGFIITSMGYEKFFLSGLGLALAGTLLFRIYFRRPR